MRCFPGDGEKKNLWRSAVCMGAFLECARPGPGGAPTADRHRLFSGPRLFRVWRGRSVSNLLAGVIQQHEKATPVDPGYCFNYDLMTVRMNFWPASESGADRGHPPLVRLSRRERRRHLPGSAAGAEIGLTHHLSLPGRHVIDPDIVTGGVGDAVPGERRLVGVGADRDGAARPDLRRRRQRCKRERLAGIQKWVPLALTVATHHSYVCPGVSAVVVWKEVLLALRLV